MRPIALLFEVTMAISMKNKKIWYNIQQGVAWQL